MHDLSALVIELEAMQPTYIDNHMGRAIQRFGLAVLDGFDPALAAEIHDLDDLKPLTVSGLMRHDGLLYGRVEPGERAWIRLTGLSASVTQALLAYHGQAQRSLASEAPVVIQLDYLPWAIKAIHISDHAWAGTMSYQQLIERNRAATPPRQIRLQFFSPTTFRSQRVNMPLPLPSLVMGSLLSRWIAFTDHRLRDLPRDQVDVFIEHHLFISQHKIETALIRGKQGGKEIGFVGTITYSISRESDHLQHFDPELEALLQAEHHWFARTMGLLAEFAFFSGIGRKTTTGMGMAKDG